MKLSVVINTLNEEENISNAIESVKEIADEIVVVDMKSDDSTKEIAKKLGARVFDHKRTGYVEPARNFAIEKAKNKWVLILDADEEASPSLGKTIRKVIEDKNADYYRLPRKNIIFGKWIKHTRYWPDYNIRLFKKGSVSWSEIIHSVPMTQGKGLDIKATEKNAIVHNHYKTISQFLERMNRYTKMHSMLKVDGGYEFDWKDLVKKPADEFISRYFQGQGYKDGVHGLAISGLQALSELVLYLKVWERERFRKESVSANEVVKVMKKAEGELHYWQADILIKNGDGLIQRFKRKFKLP